MMIITLVGQLRDSKIGSIYMQYHNMLGEFCSVTSLNLPSIPIFVL